VAIESQLDATCRRLQSSRRELIQLAQILKGDPPAVVRAGGDRHDRSQFPRSRIMRALTGQQSKKVLGQAALALAMSRPKMAWRLAGMAPLLRPLLVRYVTERLLRSRQSNSAETQHA
jgi:hypothetical protein